jgi:energy-coupling factor transporter ATP-binding protein EcfA2
MVQFRGVRSLHVDDLRRFNVIVGKNNAGKTTLLEGIFLLGGATNPVFATTIGQLRGQRLGKFHPDALWRSLFFQMNPRTPVEVEARWDTETGTRKLSIEALAATRYADRVDSTSGGGIASVKQQFIIGGLKLRYRTASGEEVATTAVFDPQRGLIDAPSQERNDFVPTTYLSARQYSNTQHDAQQFSLLLRTKQEDDVLEAMRIIEPRIERIEVLSEPAGPTVYVDLGLDSLVPLAVCGEGFVRLFSIVIELTASRGGVLLIDEIDNGLHYSVMERLWILLRALSHKHDVQVFATTHNEDIVRSALAAFSSDLSDLSLIRIDRRDGLHRATSYDDSAMTAVLEEHFEVRG